jgi:hypothetical protein
MNLVVVAVVVPEEQADRLSDEISSTLDYDVVPAIIMHRPAEQLLTPEELAEAHTYFATAVWPEDWVDSGE